MAWGESSPFVVCFALSLVACVRFTAADEETPEGPEIVADVNDGRAGVGAAPSAPRACESTTSFAEIEADTMVPLDANPSACNGDASYGEVNGLNVAVGGGAVRFRLSPAQRADLAADRVSAIRLELASHPQCTGCEPGLPARAGTVTVRAMRSDWDEGTRTGHTGADACRRTKSSGWGTSEVVTSTSRITEGIDTSPFLAGATTYADGAMTVTVALDPESIRPAAAEPISFWIRSSAQLVIASREASPGRPPPRLAITRCP